MSRSCFDLTDKEGSIISPLFPTGVRGVPRLDDRRMINGIIWRFRTGSPSADIPERYGAYRLELSGQSMRKTKKNSDEKIES